MIGCPSLGWWMRKAFTGPYHFIGQTLHHHCSDVWVVWSRHTSKDTRVKNILLHSLIKIFAIKIQFFTIAFSKTQLLVVVKTPCDISCFIKHTHTKVSRINFSHTRISKICSPRTKIPSFFDFCQRKLLWVGESLTSSPRSE